MWARTFCALLEESIMHGESKRINLKQTPCCILPSWKMTHLVIGCKFVPKRIMMLIHSKYVGRDILCTVGTKHHAC